MLKEIVIPAGADKIVFLLAPLLTFIFAAIAWVVIPFADGWVIADLNVGVLYIFAISSLGVYGVIMGGWASNSKYPFLGGLRSAAQMVSYEVSIGLIIVGVLISTGLAEPLRHRARAGRALWAAQLVLAAALPDDGDLLRQRDGRDQPPALRPARG